MSGESSQIFEQPGAAVAAPQMAYEEPVRRPNIILRSRLIRGALVPLTGLVLTACTQADASGNHSSDPTTTIASADAALESALSVNLIAPDANCVDIISATDTNATSDGSLYKDGKSYIVQPQIGAEIGLAANGTPGGRLFSDALETPLPNPEDAGLSLKDIDATICKDPLFGSTLANMFANMDINGVKVVDLNSWLKPYDFDASQPVNDIAAEAASFFPLTNSNGQPEESTDENKAYTQFAEKLVTLLDRFQNNGEGTYMTTLNYVLSGGDLVAGEFPQVEENPTQYLADGLWLTLTRKTGGCYVQIGFNRYDQRPEESNVCEVTPPTTTPTSPNNTPGVPNNNYIPPRTPGSTPNHSPTTTTPTTTKIGPKQNPLPPVPGGETTTIPSDEAGGPIPTTSTTTPTTLPTGETTVPDSTSTSTTSPAGGCGEICDN